MMNSADIVDGRALHFLRSRLLRIHLKLLISQRKSQVVAIHLRDSASSTAQRLPPELLVIVLGQLLVHTHAAYVVHDAHDASRVASYDQQCLLWASRTCRDWYAVGSELLYSSPFLSTIRSVELFARTLTATPTLSGYVKDVYVPLNTQGTTSDTLGWIWGRRSAKIQHTEVVDMLSHCPSLESLTIRHTVKDSLISKTPVDTIIRQSLVDHALRQLTVYGSTCEARWHPQFCIAPALSDILLPNLQVLCLRRIYILPTFHLPPFPRLHTLQLVQNYYFASTGMAGPMFTSETLPALHTLEIFDNHFNEGQLSIVLDLSRLASLETLTFVQEEHCLSITRLLPVDGRIKHLALGVLRPVDHTGLTCWRLSPTLESLTFLLPHPQRPQAAAERASVTPEAVEIMDGVYQCLQQCLHIPPQRALALKQVTLVHGGGHSKSDRVRVSPGMGVCPKSDHAAWNQVTRLCTTYGISCELLCQSSDIWIADRLAQRA